MKAAEQKMEPMTYFITMGIMTLINSCVSSDNASDQRELSLRQHTENMNLRKEELCARFEQERAMFNKKCRFDIEQQLRSFRLNHTWPLVQDPLMIADIVSSHSGNVPLYFVFAPLKNGPAWLQNNFNDLYTEMGTFLTNVFSVNSDTPVILGRYRDNQNVEPASDYMTIWHGLNKLPTIYIAPYSTEKEAILGFRIACWGFNGTRPATRVFEIDCRKLFIDEVRKETEEFQQLNEELKNSLLEYSDMKSNIQIFNQEKEILGSGKVSTEYIEQHTTLYRGLKPSKAVYTSLRNHINPVIKSLLSSMADIYFVLQYGTTPKFHDIVKNIKGNYKIADVLMRSHESERSDYHELRGEQFLDQLEEDYSLVVAQTQEHSGNKREKLPTRQSGKRFLDL